MKKFLLSAFAFIGLAFAAIAAPVSGIALNPMTGQTEVVAATSVAPVPDVPNWRFASVEARSDLIHLVPDHALSGGDGRPI